MLLRALILLDGPLAIVVSPPTQGQLPDQTGPHEKPRFSAPVYIAIGKTSQRARIPEVVRGAFSLARHEANHRGRCSGIGPP